jgi:hypothetical protein
MSMLPTQNNAEAGTAPDGGRRPTVVAAPASASPELTARPRRRTFTARDKLRILAETDRAAETGGIGAVLRREGVYSSTLGRKARAQRVTPGSKHFKVTGQRLSQPIATSRSRLESVRISCSSFASVTPGPFGGLKKGALWRRLNSLGRCARLGWLRRRRCEVRREETQLPPARPEGHQASVAEHKAIPAEEPLGLHPCSPHCAAPHAPGWGVVAIGAKLANRK